MNANHRKGMDYERALRDYLRQDHGRAVVRPRQEVTAQGDIGDLTLSPFTIQAKNVQAITLSSYVDDANKQAAAAGELYGVAIVKRRGRPVQDSYVVMDLATFSKVVGEVRAARAAGLSG